MKPDITSLLHAAPGCSRQTAEQHLERLGENYFKIFNTRTVAFHLDLISRLSAEQPVCVHTDHRASLTTCTIIAFDYPFAFSLITGILGSTGFSIQSGTAFTYEQSPYQASRSMHRRRYLRQTVAEDVHHRRKIIDTFIGYRDISVPHARWQETISERLRNVFSMLEKQDTASVAKAKMMVAEYMIVALRMIDVDYDKVLYPVQIDFDSDDNQCTHMKISSEDTPFFLYTLSTALSLHGITIRGVSIQTHGDAVCDTFDLVDKSGKKIVDDAVLSSIRLSVLLTKQFTYFLGKASDPFSALERFEELVEDLARSPGKEQVIDLLSNPSIMQDCARLFGASTFLWEDFIRGQYEELIPMVSETKKANTIVEPVETLYWRLDEQLSRVKSFDEKISRINAFKDREIFLIDLNNIINNPSDFKILAEQLTMLAEIIINVTAEIVYDSMIRRYGIPRTAAGLEAKYAVLGLGKMGGAALGYASDIELLFVYSDNGSTDGDERISNAEFYNLFVKNIAASVKAKREGIFTIDLRLRPYGNDGPLACSLDTFCSYYGKGGDAHAYERLALVRLRAIGGEKDFGLQVERLRDEILYASKSIDLQELKALRKKQLTEKTSTGKINAKFSAGALVDLEYTVQLLQIMHGVKNHSLRTPRIHKALQELARAGVLGDEECRQLLDAYDFFRHLINGLRMLRGSARDLFLPETGSTEYMHLARRLEYTREDELDPSKRLELDFETHTAVVRTFIKNHFGKNSLPVPEIGNVADLVLSANVPLELAHRVLSGYGFTQPERAYRNLTALCGQDKILKEQFARLALLACDLLTTTPDPDMALNNWERFTVPLSDKHGSFQKLMAQPMRLEILLKIFAGSQFLADTLIGNPDLFDWITDPGTVNSELTAEAAMHDLRSTISVTGGHDQIKHALRSLKKRETLRIGTRDICMDVPVHDIVAELSTLAEASVEAAFEHAVVELSQRACPGIEPDRLLNAFCIAAFGKLGGSELNYSSDIDLLGIYDEESINGVSFIGYESAESFFSAVLSRIREYLSEHTEDGYAYRVDLRLRPYGRSGPLACSIGTFIRYFSRDASLWEIQALLKLRAVAGSLTVGGKLAYHIRALLNRAFAAVEIAYSINSMREAAVQQCSKRLSDAEDDIKNGPGGIRDIEFAVQGLQLLNIVKHTALLEGNTLRAVDLLEAAGFIAAGDARDLKKDYILLRKTEHVLQIFEDRQVHALPQSAEHLNALSKRIFGRDADSALLLDKLSQCRKRVRALYARYVLQHLP